MLYLKKGNIEAAKAWAKKLGIDSHSPLIDEMITAGLEELEEMEKRGDFEKDPETKKEIEKLKKEGGGANKEKVIT